MTNWEKDDPILQAINARRRPPSASSFDIAVNAGIDDAYRAAKSEISKRMQEQSS